MQDLTTADGYYHKKNKQTTMTRTTNKKVKRLPGGGFRGEDGKEIFCVPVEGESMSWELLEKEPITLTEEEQSQADLLGYDLEKLLLVKQLLSQEETPTTIHEKTGISRNTVYNYKKILSPKYSKYSRKYSQSTRNSNSVLSMVLLFNGLGSQSTLFYFILGVLLLIVVGDAWARSMRKAKAARIAAHREDIKELRRAFYKVLDWMYKRRPILVTSEKEKAYYKKMLKHYKNSGRQVKILLPHAGEKKADWNSRKNSYLRTYYLEKRQDIEKGEDAYKEAFEKIKDAGMLDYFSNPMALESKLFLLEFAMEYLAAPKPVSDINTTNKLEWDNFNSPS